jgi:hypothetical protein
VIKPKATQPAAVVTHEGAPGYERKAKGELFLLAVTNMVGENTFYETAESRDARFEELIHKVTAKDPDWIRAFIPYLRDTLNMRTASIVMAAEYVKAGGPNGRSVVSSALLRAEEPSVLLAYWMSKYGKKLPAAIKRGVADATVRLYNEKSFIKYDSDNLSPRFGDVIELTHPKGATPWQHSLFKFAIDKRHNREDLARNVEELSTIKAYRELMALPVAERRPLLDKAIETGDLSSFEGAGLTWENLSGWLQGPMDAKAWEVIIPQMGYMALLRNLRNFSDAKISSDARAKVVAKLTDPAEVAKSRQLPIRFVSAWKNADDPDWAGALEKAVDLSLANVPALSGKTLVLVDVSGSMDSALSSNHGRTFKSGNAKYPLRWEVAALFGAAVAVRSEKADLVAFSDSYKSVDFRKGGGILRTVDRFRSVMMHGGTNTHIAVAGSYKDHDRIVIVTDEQASSWGTSYGYGYGSNAGQVVSDIKVPIYIFNVAGYKQGMKANDKTYVFGGLTDHAFTAIETLEAYKDEKWPWETK